MILRFKLREFDDIQEEYADLLGEAGYSDTTEQDGIVYSAQNYRIVIPKIELSFRYALVKVLNETVEDAEDGKDADDEDAEAGQDIDYECYLSYEENEKDVNKWISATADSIISAVYNKAYKYRYDLDQIEKLNCYIDTSEFLPSEDDQETKPEEWANKVKEEYPELFKAFEDWEYTIRYEPTKQYDGYICCGNIKGRLLIHIGKEYFYFSYDEGCEIAYEVEYKAGRDDKTVIDNAISTIAKFLNGDIFFVRGFIKGYKLKGIAFDYDFPNLKNANEEYLKLIKESLPEDFNQYKKIKIKHYFL